MIKHALERIWQTLNGVLVLGGYLVDSLYVSANSAGLQYTDLAEVICAI